MVKQSYIWEQFNIHCVPFCNNCVPIHNVGLKSQGRPTYMHLYFFYTAKVQMFKFGLTCFKARKDKTITILLNTGKYILFHVVTG